MPSIRPDLEVADVVRLVSDEFLGSPDLTAWQKKALRDILTCRTSVLGGHLLVCDHCGHEVPVYNSCLNRHCPKCQSLAQARWIEERKDRILPTHHFHLVFTLPAELRPIAKMYPRPVYDLLIRTAAKALETIAKDKRHLGATPAITAVLHTWTREMLLHPHVHLIVSGGGLTKDDQWKATPTNFFLPVLVLSRHFRTKFVAGIKRLVERGDVVPPETPDFEAILEKLERKDWVVYSKAPFGGAKHLFEYLGRYTHRVAISNQRLLRLTVDEVVFRTKDERALTLSPAEFVRRFLLHILPRGFTKIRHYGLLAPSAVKTRLVTARRLLEETQPSPAGEEGPRTEAEPLADEPPICPRCRKGRLSKSIRLEPAGEEQSVPRTDSS